MNPMAAASTTNRIPPSISEIATIMATTPIAPVSTTTSIILPSMSEQPTTTDTTTTAAATTNSSPPSMTIAAATPTVTTSYTAATSAAASLPKNSTEEDHQEKDIAGNNREEDSTTSKPDAMEEDKEDDNQAMNDSGSNAADTKTTGGDDGHKEINDPDQMEEDEDGEDDNQDDVVEKFQDKIKKDKLTHKHSVEVFDLLHYHAPMSCFCLGAMLGLMPGSHSVRDPIKQLMQLKVVEVVHGETVPGRDGKPGRKAKFYRLSDAAFPDPNYRTVTTRIPQDVLEAAMKEIKNKDAKKARREKNQKRRREIKDNDNVEAPPAKKSKLVCNCGTLCGGYC